MSTFVTVYTAVKLYMQSDSLIWHTPTPDGFPYTIGLYYLYRPLRTPLGLVPNLMFALNNWLADGLLVSSLFDAALTRPGVQRLLRS